MRRMITADLRKAAIIVPGLLLLLAETAAAQPAGDERGAIAAELAVLRDEVIRLRNEVSALHAALADVRRVVAAPTHRDGVDTPGNRTRPTRRAWRGVADLEPPPEDVRLENDINQVEAQQRSSTQPFQVTPELFDLLKTQVEEHAQTKVESSSRLPVKLSGTVLTNTFVNSGEANWLDNPNLAGVTPAAVSPGTMSASVRQSRTGIETTGITIGRWEASGTVIADFFGGVPNFQTGTVMGLPRLIYGFGRLENGRTAVEIGQDHVILAPRDPTSLAALSFPLFFRAGNLYLRAPQARVEQKLGARWALSAGIVAPVAGDSGASYEFAPPAGAGERSKRPAFEARLGFVQGTRETRSEIDVGVSGHYGSRRSGAALVHSWAAAFDFNIRLGRAAAAGEYYSGDNAEPFGGGISQGGRASGGWAEARLKITSRTGTTAGFGVDRPDDPAGRLLRSENRSAFGNVIFELTPEVAASVEYRWLETRFGVPRLSRENHHVNAVLAVKF
jgi:hypothetical protein